MNARQTGDSLLEVMIVLSIAAVTALGFVALQAMLSRGERMALERERATLIADSIVESTRSDATGAGDAGGASALAPWRARAASQLPGGDVFISERADGVRVATVTWHAADRADPCVEAQAKPLSACIAVAFAR